MLLIMGVGFVLQLFMGGGTAGLLPSVVLLERANEFPVHGSWIREFGVECAIKLWASVVSGSILADNGIKHEYGPTFVGPCGWQVSFNCLSDGYVWLIHLGDLFVEEG